MSKFVKYSLQKYVQLHVSLFEIVKVVIYLRVLTSTYNQLSV